MFCLSLAVCCVPGGLAAVIYTDAAQTAIMLAGSLTLMGFSKSNLTAPDTPPSPALYAPVYLILICPPVEALRRLEAGMLWWRGTETPSRQYECQTQPVVSLEMTPSTYSETRWTLTCLGLGPSSACPSPPCGTGVLTRYYNKNKSISVALFLTNKGKWKNRELVLQVIWSFNYTLICEFKLDHVLASLISTGRVVKSI